MHKSLFADLELELPPDWQDITADVPGGAPPTLAKIDGVGALQFTTGTYVGGAPPNVTLDDLVELLRDFARREGFDPLRDVRTSAGPVSWARGDFLGAADFIRVWYVSDGFSVSFITYVAAAADSSRDDELHAVDAMIRSIKFSTRPSKPS